MFYGNEEDAFVKTDELARLLRISRQTVYNWCKLGMPSFKLSNSRRFLLHDVFAWIRKHESAANVVE